MDPAITSLPAIELKAKRASQSYDNVRNGNSAIFDGEAIHRTINGLIGPRIQYQRNTMISVGYAAPIGNAVVHQFDGECRVLTSRFFYSGRPIEWVEQSLCIAPSDKRLGGWEKFSRGQRGATIIGLGRIG